MHDKSPVRVIAALPHCLPLLADHDETNAVVHIMRHRSEDSVIFFNSALWRPHCGP